MHSKQLLSYFFVSRNFYTGFSHVFTIYTIKTPFFQWKALPQSFTITRPPADFCFAFCVTQKHCPLVHNCWQTENFHLQHCGHRFRGTPVYIKDTCVGCIWCRYDMQMVYMYIYIISLCALGYQPPSKTPPTSSQAPLIFANCLSPPYQAISLILIFCELLP